MCAAPLTLVALDIETTGLDVARDRIIEVGAVRLDASLGELAHLSSLVRPEIPVPLAVTRMTGITAAELDEAPPFTDVFARLRRFTEDAVLVAHNAAFDRAHLEAAARRAGLDPLPFRWFDTLDAALLLYPEYDRHALALLAAELGFGSTAHRALPDARATAGLLRGLAARAAGLAAEERRLLEAVRWPPLRLLDAIAASPEAAPPPLVADAPESATGDAALTTLPCDADDWRAEFGASPDGSPATPARLAARMPGYVPRDGQVAMASEAASIMDEGGIGLLEAGTGMGKSLAYLLPAAFASAAAGRRVVVSTKTKALQRQLAAHELPLVAAALPAGWRWAVLMGRENYLCRRRLDEAVSTETAALPDERRALALAYLVGRARWGEVDLSALPFRAARELPALAELARELRSSRATCLGRHCPARRGCHWRLARARAEAAHLLCVNHALLLTGRDTLPAFEDVVIDEAHLLPSEATSAFSESLDWWTLELLLAMLRGAGGGGGPPAPAGGPPARPRAPRAARGSRGAARRGRRRRPHARRPSSPRSRRRRAPCRGGGRGRRRRLPGRVGGGRRGGHARPSPRGPEAQRTPPPDSRRRPVRPLGLAHPGPPRAAGLGRARRRHRGPGRTPARARRGDVGRRRRAPRRAPRAAGAARPRRRRRPRRRPARRPARDVRVRRRALGRDRGAASCVGDGGADTAEARRRAPLDAHPRPAHAGALHPGGAVGPAAQRRADKRHTDRGGVVLVLPRDGGARRRPRRRGAHLSFALRLRQSGCPCARARPGQPLATRRARGPAGRAPHAPGRGDGGPHARPLHEPPRHAPRRRRGGRPSGGRQRPRPRARVARQRRRPRRGVPLPPGDGPSRRRLVVDGAGLPRRRAAVPRDRQAPLPPPGPPRASPTAGLPRRGPRLVPALLPARGGAALPPGLRPPDPHRERRRRRGRPRPPPVPAVLP